jgi:hypothetical protein
MTMVMTRMKMWAKKSWNTILRHCYSNRQDGGVIYGRSPTAGNEAHSTTGKF